MRRNKKCKWNNKKANKSTKNNKQEPMQKQRKEKDTENKIDKRKRGILKKRYRYKKQTKVCIYRYIPFQNQYILKNLNIWTPECQI